MNANEKNALIDSAKALITSAIDVVAADVYAGMGAAPPLLIAAGQLLRQAEQEPYAVEAEQHAAECAGIVVVPWPFIYIASTAWIAGVRQLRDSLPHFVDLEPLPVARRRQTLADEKGQRAAQVRARWEKLSDAQRSVLEKAGLNAELLRASSTGNDA